MTYLSAILKSIRKRVDCDLIDQLNYYFTAFLLVAFAILVSAKQYVGYPIQCWVPAHFTEPMEQYTENYCWVQNTWWIPLSESIPKAYSRREAKQLTYYQWVPFILIFEAVLFYAPYVFWRIMSSKSDIDVQHAVRLAGKLKSIIKESERKSSVGSFASYLDKMLTKPNYASKRYDNIETNSVDIVKNDTKSFGSLRCASCDKTSGYYLTVLYITTKIMYLINIILQYFLMAYFLGTRQATFGWELFQDLIRGRQWHKSGIFPRVTLCDFEVKVMGNLHRHTIQCVLMINMFNEKIFLFLWFWYAFLFLVTVVNLIYWITLLLIPSFRYRFLKNKLSFNFDEPKIFRSKYFRSDCIFVMKLIADYAGDMVMSETFHKMLKNFNFRKTKNLTMDFKSNGNFSDSSSMSKIDVATFRPVSSEAVLLETSENEIKSFKEFLNGGNDKRNNGVKLKFRDKAKGVSSAGDRKFKKHRIWIGGKDMAFRGRMRKEKMSHKLASDDSEEEEIGSSL